MLRRSVRTTLLLVSALMALQSGIARADRPVDRPDRPGPFHVGYTSITIPVSFPRTTTQATVWYPTEQAPDCAGRYTIKVRRPGGADEAYALSSPLCAVEDGNVAVPGGFPVIIYDHGGNGFGADEARWSQIPLVEHLASHGFVVVIALHAADRGLRATDLQKVIDEMLRRNGVDPLLQSAIDPERIGMSGVSAGGGTAVAAVAGWPANNVKPEPRAKALLVYEPDPSSYSLADASTMDVPYLLMHGDQFAAWVPSFTLLLSTTTAAVPRIEVDNQGAVNRNSDTGLCLMIDDTREAALLADPTLPEPLTHVIDGNAAAEAAYIGWNLGQIRFSGFGSGVGGGRNICDRVGIHSIRPLDVDGDGLTDSPPFKAIDPPYVIAAAPSAEVTLPLIKLYSVAFWKTFLAGDRRYMTYLTPGYASRNGLNGIVTMWK